eukprot:1725215-Pleurochrysis_carterae.AAC.2
MSLDPSCQALFAGLSRARTCVVAHALRARAYSSAACACVFKRCECVRDACAFVRTSASVRAGEEGSAMCKSESGVCDSKGKRSAVCNSEEEEEWPKKQRIRWKEMKQANEKSSETGSTEKERKTCECACASARALARA